jgi:hypothetical protein
MVEQAIAMAATFVVALTIPEAWLFAAALLVDWVGLGAHPGRPDRRRDHSVCADPTQPPRRIVRSQQ